MEVNPIEKVKPPKRTDVTVPIDVSTQRPMAPNRPGRLADGGCTSGDSAGICGAAGTTSGCAAATRSR